MKYVVYCFTRVQDGHEEYAKIFSDKEAALAHVNKYANPMGAVNEFHLFELGKEIPLVSRQGRKEKVEVEEKTVYSVKK